MVSSNIEDFGRLRCHWKRVTCTTSDDPYSRKRL